MPPSPMAGDGLVPMIVFAPCSPCGRRVGDEGVFTAGTAGAVQDARAWPSTGFRPPFGLGRVTLERPKVTKGLLPRQSAGFASPLSSEPTSDGLPQTAHPCAGCGYAIIPDGVPDVDSDPRRIGGGSIPCPALVGVRHPKFWVKDGAQLRKCRPAEMCQMITREGANKSLI